MLPTDAQARKNIPLFSGLLCYFPHALAAVAELSHIGNDQHNPGQPLHWAKDKSKDEPDCIARHLVEFGIDRTHRDPDGVLAAVKIAWRALANLERLHDAGVDIFSDNESCEQPSPGKNGQSNTETPIPTTGCVTTPTGLLESLGMSRGIQHSTP